MAKSSDRKKCLRAIERQGALLTFPDANKKDPPSLWSVLYPRSEMVWEWDGDADARVSRLWILRENLARSGEVVYSKWYRGRATFFSKADFADLLAVRGAAQQEAQLRGEARQIYELLLESSPRSTKEIKLETELRGRLMEATYQRAMKQLFEAGLIVGFGEVDDGAFPSLACGATKVLFEDLWAESEDISPNEARSRIEGRWNPAFVKFLSRLKSVERS